MAPTWADIDLAEETLVSFLRCYGGKCTTTAQRLLYTAEPWLKEIIGKLAKFTSDSSKLLYEPRMLGQRVLRDGNWAG